MYIFIFVYTYISPTYIYAEKQKEKRLPFAQARGMLASAQNPLARPSAVSFIGLPISTPRCWVERCPLRVPSIRSDMGRRTADVISQTSRPSVWFVLRRCLDPQQLVPCSCVCVFSSFFAGWPKTLKAWPPTNPIVTRGPLSRAMRFW